MNVQNEASAFSPRKATRVSCMCTYAVVLLCDVLICFQDNLSLQTSAERLAIIKVLSDSLVPTVVTFLISISVQAYQSNHCLDNWKIVLFSFLPVLTILLYLIFRHFSALLMLFFDLIIACLPTEFSLRLLPKALAMPNEPNKTNEHTIV